MAPARVLHLITSLNRGGIETWLLSMLRAVPRDTCELDFCCKGSETGEQAGEAERLGARVFHCPLGPGHIGFGRALSQLLAQGGYDLLHNHLELYSGFPVWLARRACVPVVTSFHNTSFPPQMGWSCRFPLRQLRSFYGAVSVCYALRRSNSITGCSRAVLEALGSGAGRAISQGWQVLRYGLQVPELVGIDERIKLRSGLGWPADAPVIVHVGRFLEQKNHFELLRVYERVVAEIPAARLLMVGEGPLRLLVDRYVRDRHLNDRVAMLGSRRDVPRLLGACDVLLFPSLHEGLGLVALEANAASLPVVGSRIAGLTEAVRHGETAILHQVNDTDGMARSVVRILTDASYATRLGVAGRRRVQAEYSVEASACQLLALYTRTLGRSIALRTQQSGFEKSPRAVCMTG